jgi:F0F1-type ATP synthase assembly protein I
MASDDENTGEAASREAASGEAASGKSATGGGDVSWREALAAVGLALAIPWVIGVPIYIGWYLDRKYGTWPLWFIVLLLLGLLGAATDIYKLLKRFGQFK